MTAMTLCCAHQTFLNAQRDRHGHTRSFSCFLTGSLQVGNPCNIDGPIDVATLLYVTQDTGTVQEKQPEGQDGQETTETADDWKTRAVEVQVGLVNTRQYRRRKQTLNKHGGCKPSWG